MKKVLDTTSPRSTPGRGEAADTWPMWAGTCVVEGVAVTFREDGKTEVTFVTRDFREPTWPVELGAFDAVVTMQAAHEARHKRHLVPLLERARTVIAPGGVLLYADHYLVPETRWPALMPARADQPLALEGAGFVDVQLRYEEGNMALWCGANPVAGASR